MNDKTQNTMNHDQLQTTLRTAIDQHDRIHGNQWDDGEPQEELERKLTEANEAALAAGCDPFVCDGFQYLCSGRTDGSV